MKISRTVIGESGHKGIDNLIGVFLAFSGEVQIPHGCFQAFMAHVALNDPDINSLFKEMGRITVAEGMDGELFSNTRFLYGTDEGTLNA